MTTISIDEYNLVKSIGKGQFGEVFYTTKKDSNLIFATKRMKREKVEDPSYIKYFINEITILKEVYHKNIVQIESLKKTSNNYYIIMEYCNGGTLQENIDKYKLKYGRPLEEKHIQHIMRQLVDTINHLHSKGIIHRDLKPENILLNYSTEEAKNNIDILNSELKLIDFGTATHKSNNTIIGSPQTMDPLILRMYLGGQNSDLPYNEKIDIWSLGIICYLLFIGEYPFIGNFFDILNQVEKGDISVPINISAEGISFLLNMIQYSSQKRFTASELMNHPFILNYFGDFSYLEPKSVSKFNNQGYLIINIKNNDEICSIVNQCINKNKNPTIYNSINNTETNYTQSMYNNSFHNSAPIIKNDQNQFISQFANGYNSAVFYPQKLKQIDDLLGELKKKEIEFKENLASSSPFYFSNKIFEQIGGNQPMSKSALDKNQYSSKSVKEKQFYNNGPDLQTNKIGVQKIQNHNSYAIPKHYSQKSIAVNKVDNSNNFNQDIYIKNKSESSKILNYPNKEMYMSSPYNINTFQVMQNESGNQPNYYSTIINNNNISSFNNNISGP